MQNNYDIKFLKNDNTRIRAICSDSDCSFILYTYKSKKGNEFHIRKYIGKHSYGSVFDVKMTNTKLLAKRYADKFVIDPKMEFDVLRKKNVKVD